MQPTPDAAACYELGNALKANGRYPDALSQFRRAVEIDPYYVDAHSQLANLLGDLRQDDEAARHFRTVLELVPHSAEAHFNYSMWLLSRGQWEDGWPEYEWRLKTKGWSVQSLRQPRWTGQPLEGKTILLYSDQGLGDAIQFVRYANVLKQRGARVVACVASQLIPLFRSCLAIDQVLGDEDLPDFDYHSPLASLPCMAGTTLLTIPADVPYLFADPDTVEQWRHRLGPGFKIAIAWQGNPRFISDPRRSIPLDQFAPLATPSVRLISLQKGFGAEQIAATPFHVEAFEGLDRVPFMDSAAIMQLVDGVVTSDTAVAHLAGAVGAKVWVALESRADWRWLLDRSDSPWYPTMRLFRQKRLGDWKGVFGEIEAALRERVQSSRFEVKGQSPKSRSEGMES